MNTTMHSTKPTAHPTASQASARFAPRRPHMISGVRTHAADADCAPPRRAAVPRAHWTRVVSFQMGTTLAKRLRCLRHRSRLHHEAPAPDEEGRAARPMSETTRRASYRGTIVTVAEEQQ
jgi:hypothetical protein